MASRRFLCSAPWPATNQRRRATSTCFTSCGRARDWAGRSRTSPTPWPRSLIDRLTLSPAARYIRCSGTRCWARPGHCIQLDLLLVRGMIDAAEQARALVAGRTASEVDDDRQRRDALLWNFTVLGEAA